MSPRFRISSALNSSRAEERRAPRIPRQRRERRDRRPDAAEAAEVRLDAPDGDDDAARHAVLRSTSVEQRLDDARASGGPSESSARQAPRDVGLERQDGLGLGAIALEDDRQRLVDAGERLVDDLLADAARERLGPDARRATRRTRGAPCPGVSGCGAGRPSSAAQAGARQRHVTQCQCTSAVPAHAGSSGRHPRSRYHRSCDARADRRGRSDDCRLRRARAARGGIRRRSRGGRRRRASRRRSRQPYDVAIVDLMLPQTRRPGAHRRAAPARPLDAGADPERPPLGRRPRARSAGGRRRLPDQAVRVRRAARARAGARPARHAHAGADDADRRRSVARSADAEGDAGRHRDRAAGRASSRCSST